MAVALVEAVAGTAAHAGRPPRVRVEGTSASRARSSAARHAPREGRLLIMGRHYETDLVSGFSNLNSRSPYKTFPKITQTKNQAISQHSYRTKTHMK